MSSTTLEDELKIYNNMIKQNDLALNKLSQFFKNMSKNGLIFLDKTKKSLDDLFLELKKENSSATHIISLTNFYNGFTKYLDKMKIMLQNFDTQCANKIVEFSNTFKNNCNNPLKNLSKLDLQFKEHSLNLDKVKNDYFNVNKSLVELESKNNQLKESKNKKEEECKKTEELIQKYKKDLEINNTKYFTEINKYNKSLIALEKEYKIETDKIYKEQENKIKFLYQILNIFKDEINNFSQSNAEIISIITKLNKSMNISRDVDLFKDEYNFCNDDNRRFLEEGYLDYEVYKKNTEEAKSLKNKKTETNYKKMFGFGKKDDEDKKEEKKISELIQKIISNKEKLEDNDSQYLMEYVDKEKNNRFKFIDILKDNYSDKAFIKVENIFNFNVLSSMIQLIIDKNSNNIEAFYDKFFFIIQISENMICDDNNSISIKNYLCHKISKLSIFSKKQFWLYLINKRIKDFTEEKTKQEIEKKEKGKTIRGSTLGKSTNNYFNKFKGMLSFNNDNSNKKVENEIVMGIKYKENLKVYCVEVIEEYIQHFSNFNFDRARSRQIIDELFNKYKFDKIYYEYFIAEINSNTHSSKMQIEIFQSNDKTIDFKKLKLNIKNKDSINDNPKLNALIYSINYLDIDDYKNIMILNRECYDKLKKPIYIKILLKYPNINVDKKIAIWKIILNYHENKKKYNYNEIKDKVMKTPINNDTRDIIDLDVVRTSFRENKELNQKQLGNILKAIVEIIPGLQYNQGMNYIGAFLLSITKDEEQSFYLFLGLITSTEYGELLKNDLAKLKKIFYIFERLISIFLPELYTYFLDNNIKVNYFLSSWFITLFTNTFQYINENQNPQILLKIWDLFFLDDWKSIIITSISLLKNYESKILVLCPEELIYFLISTIIKENYFQNENYDKFMYNMFNFKIEDELIKKIEKEIDIKNRMPNLGKNLKFQII